MDTNAGHFQKEVSKLKKEIVNWSMWQFMKKEIDQFRETMPLIENLRHEAMRERHWAEIKVRGEVEFFIFRNFDAMRCYAGETYFDAMRISRYCGNSTLNCGNSPVIVGTQLSTVGTLRRGLKVKSSFK